MKCKKAIMGLAALLIFIFHFYIPITNKAFEMTLYRGAFIGVDMFFLVSGYSIGKRGVDKIWPFWKNRLLSVYLPFAVFCLVDLFVNSRKIGDLAANLFGVSFFTKGGGAFLWFLFGVLLFYLAAPGIDRLKKKWGFKALPVFLVLWAAVAVLLQYAFGYTAVFILWNRLPIFLLGIWYEDLRTLLDKKVPRAWQWVCFGLLLAAGCYIFWQFGVQKRMTKPLVDFQYLLAVPATFGLVRLWDMATEKAKIRLHVLEWVGGFTLELYGLQMLFGYKVEPWIMKKTGLKFGSFLLALVFFLAASYLVSLARKGISVAVKKIFQKKPIKE